jgi:hypothetical protein
MTARSTLLVVLALVAWLGLGTGCDRPILRDHYMGKSWLQPETEPRTVIRDPEGEPIIEEDDTPPPE